MRGMKSFVLGFSLSLFSMSVGGQLYSSAAGKTHLPLQTDIKIDLFKTKEDAINKAASDILTKVQKQTITTSAISGLTEKPSASASAPDKADSFRFLSEKELPETETAEIAYAPQDINGIEDDEILSVNIDGSIPIEFENTDKQNLNAEIAQSEDENKVAMLPTSTLSDSEDFIPDTPWVVAKGSKHIKTKSCWKNIKTSNRKTSLPTTSSKPQTKIRKFPIRLLRKLNKASFPHTGRNIK